MEQDIEIYIDEIILDGFGHVNVPELKEAISDHIVRLVSENGMQGKISGTKERRIVTGGEIRIDAGGDAGKLGVEIAGGAVKGISNVIGITNQKL